MIKKNNDRLPNREKEITVEPFKYNSMFIMGTMDFEKRHKEFKKLYHSSTEIKALIDSWNGR